MSTPVRRVALSDARPDRLYFAQVHEDPLLELEVLRPGSGDVILTVGSGGCTALSLLAAGAGRVEAVDLNPVQNHLVELKVAACLLGGDAATTFLGGRPASGRWRIRMYGIVRAELGPGARDYWDRRQRIVARGVLGAGVSERFLTGLRRVLTLLVHPPGRVRGLLSRESLEAQRSFYARRWDTRRWRALYALLLARRSLERTYDPAFFVRVENPSFSEHFRGLFEHAVTELPVADNYFLHHALTGAYPPSARPPYLTAEGARAVRDGRDRLLLVDGTLTSRLRALPEASVTGFALSNICEWLGPEEVDELFAEIARTAAPEARVCLRNFVGWTEVPPRWRGRVVEDRERGEALWRRDRSLVNRRFAVCSVGPADGPRAELPADGARAELPADGQAAPAGADRDHSARAAGRGVGTAADPDPPAARPAAPADNPGLLQLAAACPMMADVALCVERSPDFFALNRLQGERWRVGVAEGTNGGIAGCVSIATRSAYLRGRESSTLYLSDFKVHPEHRGTHTADALTRWVWEEGGRMAERGTPALIAVLAGNRSMERRTAGPRGLPRFRRLGTVRSLSLPLLWPGRRARGVPRDGSTTLRRAAADDLEPMAALWRRVAPGRQFAPVLDADGLARFIDSAPGLEIGSYLLALGAAGEPLGFLGLWDQEDFKQMRVVRYSPGTAAARRTFNLFAPVVRATPLPGAGGVLRYLAVLHLCVPPDRPDVLRSLILFARAEARGGGYSFLSLGLDARDPLNLAFHGLWTQETRIDAYLTTASGAYEGSLPDERPLHFETSLV